MSQLLYLDQNIWIEITHSLDDRESNVYDTLVKLTDKTGFICPISSEHIIELSKIDDLNHRERIARVMVEISGGWFLSDEHSLVVSELQRAFARVFDKLIPSTPSPIGRGIHFAFGKSDSFYYDLSQGIRDIDDLKQKMESPSALLFILVGRDDEATKTLMIDLENKAMSFAQKVDDLRSKAKSYSKAVRKRAYIANLTYQLQDDLKKILNAYGYSLDWFLNRGSSWLMNFFNSISCLNVEMELSVARDEYWNRSIDPNDLYDVSFLSVAIPYCQHVVTERHWVHIAESRKLTQQYSTNMYSKLDDLFSTLEIEKDSG
jgi:hypothetical protein